jgi:hypothetical protein
MIPPGIKKVNVINAKLERSLDGKIHLHCNVVDQPFEFDGVPQFVGPNQEWITPPILGKFPGGFSTGMVYYQVLGWQEDHPNNLIQELESIL